MSILIKGIEMPKNCDGCRIMALEDTNCEAELYCGCPIVFKAHPQGVDHRPGYCPLIPVQPHGRLIDADALNVIGYCGIPQGSEDTFDDGVMWLAKQIDLLPTIIEAEEGE